MEKDKIKFYIGLALALGSAAWTFFWKFPSKPHYSFNYWTRINRNIKV